MHLRAETELGAYENERFFNMLNNATESKEKKNRTSLSGMENKALLLSCLQTRKLYWQVFGGLLKCLLLFFLVMLLQNILYKICVMRDYFA